MSAPECERNDDVAAYALGALEPDEASELSAADKQKVFEGNARKVYSRWG